MEILGIDIGGTAIKAARVDTTAGALIGERLRIATPRPATPDRVGEALAEIVGQFAWRGPLGVGFPAAIQRGIARSAANVDAGFIGLPIESFFSRLTGCPVFAANDADVAGLAEMRLGAARDKPGVVLFVTIGTGLGSALFTDGCLLPNTELGHLYFEDGIEAERYASEAVRIGEALDWATWGGRLNRYLMLMEQRFWPDWIVLGGGVSKELEHFARYLTTHAPIMAAHFLNQAGIIGAALYAEQRLAREDSGNCTSA